MPEDIAAMICELEEEETLDAVRKALEEGVDPLTLVESLREGMSIVGRRFEDKEYFLSELIMSAEIFKEAIEIIEPRLDAGYGEPKGKVVIGTVQGDIHDIGKNIVATLLRCDGFEVHDVGVDAPVDAFVAKLKETGAAMLGLSGLLTVAFDGMKAVVESVEASGLRDSVKIFIGGGPVDQSVVDYTGADAFGKDAAEAVKLANSCI